MDVPYYRYKATYAAPSVPAWSNTWPGYDGCSNRTLTLTVSPVSQPPNPGSVLYYSPYRLVTSWKSPTRSGRNKHRWPPFHFTSYSRGIVEEKQYLITTKRATTGINVYYQYGTVPRVGGACTPTESRRAKTGPLYSTYVEQSRDFSSYNTFVKNDINAGDILAASIDVRNALVEEATATYDILTDIAQLHEIPQMIKQYSSDLTRILETLKSRFGKDVMSAARCFSPKFLLKHPSKVFRELGKEWMAYRYGIMPLVYSVRDIMKVMNRGSIVYTRQRKVISPSETGQALPPSTDTYLLEDVQGDITIRGEIFQAYSSTELARLSGYRVNPLVTAWELIPYSFVIDWFINVGGYIASTTSVQPWSQTTYACLSTRQNYSRRTWVHLPTRDFTYSVVKKLPVNWVGVSPPSDPSTVINNPEGLYLLNEVVTNWYEREVIPVTGVAPTFNPSLNWRRLIDGAVLSLNQLGRLLRHL